MPSLSVCMMVQNSERTLAIALESLCNVYDELIIVDGGSDDSTCDIALSYGAKIIHSPWTGNHSQQRNVYLKAIKTDWFFVLDSDEFINIRVLDFLRSLKLSNDISDTDNFSIPRRWLSPFSRNHYIISEPHFPDLQRRLFKYSQNIFYQGQIHELIYNLHKGEAIEDSYVAIYHLDLLINTEAQRQAKVRKYSQVDPRDGARHLYLPNKKQLQTRQWSYSELIPSVQILLNNLFDSQIEQSEINSIIPAEIKDDKFYDEIQKIARIEDISTILEIGSSAGMRNTEALVTGIKSNPNSPKLFCIEVSITRFTELEKKYQHDSFVKCYNASSIPFNKFPDEQEILDFYHSAESSLNFYPVEQIIGWLRQDIEYIKNSGVIDAGIQKIKQENKIDFFDLVLIDGSEFTGIAELEEVYGAKYICLDDINTFKNYQNYQRLLNDTNYSLLVSNYEDRSRYAIFKRIVPHRIKNSNLTNPIIIPELPVHFFTIVLNGQPFIQYHIEVFKQLPFKWHWHIVEGVAELTHDTAWSLKLGGKITDTIHCNGLSNDGTTKYLDELKQQYPQNITIYRKPNGDFWQGKREMVNEPLYNINEECLLWQIDVDELWIVEQIIIGRQIFRYNPAKTAAFYWCWYFVGQDLIIGTRNCYAQNPQQDWLRTWRYKPGAVWVAHEPPKLEEPLVDGQWRDVASINPFLHSETESFGLVFQHFAYVTEEQLRFKEQYYGYNNAVSQWNKLKANTKFPVRLGEYFAWVQDHTQVDLANSWTVVPIAQKDLHSNVWQFLQPAEIQQQTRLIQQGNLVIVVDGVFFQLYQTGIARVWKSLLEEWSNNGFARYIVVLDRGKTAPRISGTKFPGVRYRDIERYDYSDIEADQEMLQEVCDEESANLFISSYYTTPTTTPSVLMIHDMIPELLGWDLEHAMWKGKHHAIQKASAYISVSENTAKDLVELFPDISEELITIAKNGVNHQIFSPASQENINYFRTKYDIRKPYFLLVGAGSGYKNSILFFQAFSELASSSGFDILITGTGGLLSPELRSYTSGSTVYMLQLTDQELVIAYSGALALVYPSKYEGFGMPIIEAMACGCPVITCRNSALPEAAGEAAIYVNHDDVQRMANAICDVQKPSFRSSLIADGLSQAKKFSWTKMAEIISSALLKATLLPLNLQEINLIIFPDWTQPEEIVSLQIEQVIKALGNYPKREQTTLLIYVNDIAAEDAELFLSSVMMNLLIQENLDITDEFVISLVVNLASIQLQTLLPKIHARIILEQEDQQVLQQIPLEKIRAYQIDKLVDLESG